MKCDVTKLNVLSGTSVRLVAVDLSSCLSHQPANLKLQTGRSGQCILHSLELGFQQGDNGTGSQTI